MYGETVLEATPDLLGHTVIYHWAKYIRSSDAPPLTEAEQQWTNYAWNALTVSQYQISDLLSKGIYDTKYRGERIIAGLLQATQPQSMTVTVAKLMELQPACLHLLQDALIPFLDREDTFPRPATTWYKRPPMGAPLIPAVQDWAGHHSHVNLKRDPELYQLVLNCQQAALDLWDAVLDDLGNERVSSLV